MSEVLEEKEEGRGWFPRAGEKEGVREDGHRDLR